MRLVRWLLVANAILISACAGNAGNTSVAIPREASAAQKSTRSFGVPNGFLYITSQDGLTVYAGPNLKFTRNVNAGQLASGVAVDRRRHVLFGGPSDRVVRIYTQGGVKQLGTLSRDQDIPYKVTISSRGDVYVGNYIGYNIFINGEQNKVKHLHDLPGGQITVDGSDNFYIGLNSQVRVYKSRSKKIAYTITNGLSAVASLATDAQGNLYVGNGYQAAAPCGNVQVYAPGATSPSYSIGNGICVPGALTLDANGNLYVANSGYGGSTGTTVTEYAAGTPNLINQISGLSRPTSLTMDSAGDLYVGNTNTNSIEVFPPGSSSPSQSLSTSISAPNAIVWAAK